MSPILLVPDHILFTLVQSSYLTDQVPSLMESDDCVEVTNDIDLMETDNESDMNYESENDSDIAFMDDDETMAVEDVSFYRYHDNNDLLTS